VLPKRQALVISRIRHCEDANTHEIPIIKLREATKTCPAASVIPVPLASSVISVVTQSWEPG